MTSKKKKREAQSEPDSPEDEDAELLPDREAMSVIQPPGGDPIDPSELFGNQPVPE